MDAVNNGSADLIYQPSKHLSALYNRCTIISKSELLTLHLHLVHCTHILIGPILIKWKHYLFKPKS